MSDRRPGWYRVRIEGCTSWQCAEVVDSSSDPSADPRFVEWAGRDWPITDIAEWGERITMPDEALPLARPATHPCFLGGRTCGDDPYSRCRDCPFGGFHHESRSFPGGKAGE